MNRRTVSVALFLLLLLTAVVPSAEAGTPEERVAAYHQALLDGDMEAAKGMLSEDLLLYEDGLVETSRKQYAKSHLKADIAFSEKARRKLESRSTWIDGDTATVSSTYDLKTRYKGRRYHIKAAETMILRRADDQWTIVHVHWSNHQVKE